MARWRQIARATLKWLAVAVVVVLVTVMFVLTTNVGLRMALAIGLPIYNDAIAGTVAVEAVEGRLLGSFTLRGVRLTDGSGQALVTVEAIAVDWSPGALLGGDLEIAMLEIERPQVFLPGEGGGFADLAPPGEDVPKDMSLPPGPDLPLGIDVGLRVRDAAVFAADGAPIVEAAAIEGRARGVGRAAMIAVTGGQGRLLGARAIRELVLEARWAAPLAAIDGLRVVVDAAVLEIPTARLDVRALRGRLELEARAALAELAALLPAGVVATLEDAGGQAGLKVVASGDPRDMSAAVRVDLGPGLALEASGTGGWQGPKRAELRAAANVDLGPWTRGQLGRVRPVLELHAREVRDGQVGVIGGLRCRECEGLGGLKIDVDGVIDPRRDGLSFETALGAAGVEALVDVRAVGGVLRQFDWRLAVVDLGRTAAMARQFAAVPEVRGTLAGRGLCVGPELRCAGSIALLRLVADGVAVGEGRIDVNASTDDEMSQGTAHVEVRELRGGGGVVEHGALRLEVATLGPGPVGPPIPAGVPRLRADLRAAARGPGGEGAHVDLSVRTGEALVAELRELDVEHGGLRVALDGPARAVLSGTRLEVEEVALAVAGGRLAVDGVVDMEGRSDLRVDVVGVSLARLRRLMPGLRPRGIVAAQIRLQGRPEAPELRADLSVARAGLRGEKIGDLALGVGLKDGRGEVELALCGPLARGLWLDADVPVRVDLAKRTWSIEQEYTRVELRADTLRLARLGPWLGDNALGGRVDGLVLLEAHGSDETLATPRIVGEWRGRDLSFNETPLGDVAVSFSHRGQWLQGKVDVHRSGGRARLDVQVPLELDVMGGSYVWDRQREHRALLQVEDLDVAAQLEGVAPGHDVEGRVTLRAELIGPATAPALEAELKAEGLRYRKVSLGAFSLSAVMRDGGMTLDAGGGGGHAGRFQARAMAPISVGASGLRWRRDGWYAVDVDLHELELAPLAPLLGADVSGRVTGGVSFDGAGRRPRLHGSVHGDRLVYRGERVGTLGAEVEYRDGTAVVAGRGRLGVGTDVRIDARVPVDVDLVAGTMAWTTKRKATVQLDVTGLDRETLAPFNAMPEQALIGVEIHAQAEIDAEHVRGRAMMTGQIGHKVMGGRPVVVRLDVEDAKQSLRASLGRLDRKGTIALDLDARASIPAIRRGEASVLATPIDGELKAAVTDLRYLNGFLPESLYDLTGAFTSAVTVRGELGAPVFRGSARLAKAGITVVPLQQRFRDLSFEVVADGPKLTLTRLSATSGKGRMKASGAATFAAGGVLTAEAELDLRKFPVVRPGLPQMTVDTHVRAEVKSSPEALGVNIDVGETEVWVSDLTTRAPAPIPENENITFVAGPLPGLQAQVGSQEAATRPEAPVVEIDEDDPKNMSLRVRLRSPVHIQGTSMDMRWSGALALQRRGGAAEVTGGFHSDRGRFELLGTEFQIDQGRVFLPEDGVTIDPYVDLTADASTPQAEVRVGVRGRLSRPELRLSSRPAMTEGQIFALLLTGTADTQETDPKRTQASAAGLLLNFSNPTLSRFADQKFGIDRIKFGFADDVTQPVLTVGKHLTKEIYTETTYHHNAPPRHNRIEGQIEYRFKPNWSVETFFGDAAVGGLDVFWRRRFGGARRAAKATPATKP